LLQQDRKVRLNVTLRHETTADVEKQYVLRILRVFVALAVNLSKHMRRILLSYVACLAVPYFSTLSHKRQDFRGKKSIKGVSLFFSKAFV
jgi:hypothetical protein